MAGKGWVAGPPPPFLQPHTAHARKYRLAHLLSSPALPSSRMLRVLGPRTARPLRRFTAFGHPPVARPCLHVLCNACARAPQAVLSDSIRAEDCGRSEFYVEGDIGCRTCVPGAVCNGTGRLVTAPNWWRPHNRTLKFHECGAAQPCVGGVEAGLCARGFQGPLCGSCGDGYAGERCLPCDSAASARVVLGVMLTLFVLAVSGLIFSALRKGHGHQGNNLLITFKILMMYSQVLGLGLSRGGGMRRRGGGGSFHGPGAHHKWLAPTILTVKRSVREKERHAICGWVAQQAPRLWQLF